MRNYCFTEEHYRSLPHWYVLYQKTWFTFTVFRKADSLIIKRVQGQLNTLGEMNRGNLGDACSTCKEVVEKFKDAIKDKTKLVRIYSNLSNNWKVKIQERRGSALD